MDELLGTGLVAILDAAQYYVPWGLEREPKAGPPPKRGLEVNWPWVFFVIIVFTLLGLARRH